MLAAGMALAGASALPAADWRDTYRGTDVRSDYRDIRRDEVAIDRLREVVAADRARLDEDYRCGRRWAVGRDSAALNRDQRTLEARMRDIRSDRNDLRHDRFGDDRR
jgi:hypothetical protein